LAVKPKVLLASLAYSAVKNPWSFVAQIVLELFVLSQKNQNINRKDRRERKELQFH